MGNVTVERAAIDIDEQLARYRNFTEERHALLDRIRKAESQRQSVKEDIFQRVHDEYSRELRDIEDELEPLAKEIEEARASLRDEMRDIEERTGHLKDKLDELSFRFRVGEFDESVLNERCSPLTAEHERFTERHRELSDALARITSCEETRGKKEPEDVPSRRAEADPPGAPSCEGAFVDPTDWVEEFVPEDSPADPAATDLRTDAYPSAPRPSAQDAAASRPSAAADDFDEDASRDEALVGGGHAFHAEELAADRAHDPLSELADPDDELGEETAADKSRPAPGAGTRPVGLPILTISKGPGTGKSLPLLPMTMTLGREVDNNIEIRDMNVARYHARISFEAGKYVIENLEGSPGTYVDGQKITKAALGAGAVIRVGGTELTLSLG